MYICRIVSLDLGANLSSEVEILCHKADCGLINPMGMAVVKDHIYILQVGGRISMLEGMCVSLVLACMGACTVIYKCPCVQK